MKQKQRSVRFLRRGASLRHILLFTCLCSFCALSVVLTPEGASALSPSNSGYAGLWEYPTAEMPPDGTGWIGYSDNTPYISYYGNFAYLPWLEVNLRLTAFTTPPHISDGYGRYKDKAMDLKLMLLTQRGAFPSLAVGVTDLMGTELLKAEYAVMTWKWDRLALSLGYGTKRMNGLFGGLSWSLSDSLEFKAEYSPLDYTKDAAGGAKIHPDAASSKINAGFVYHSPWGPDLSVSYQRGEEVCFSLSYNFDVREPFFRVSKNDPGKKGPPAGASPAAEWSSVEPEALASSILEALEQHGGLRDIEVLLGDRTLLVAYENIAYASEAEAMARVLSTAALFVPADTRTVSLTARVRGIPVVRVDVPGAQCALLLTGALGRSHLSSAVVSWASTEDPSGMRPDEQWTLSLARPEGKRGRHDVKAVFSYEPRIDRTLKNDYEHRFNVDLIHRYRTSKGWETVADVRVPLVEEADIWWEPELNDKTRIWQAVIAGMKVLEDGTDGRRTVAMAEAGWLDTNWFGVNAWLRSYMNGGRWWLGARAAGVKQRDPYSFAGLNDTFRTYNPGGPNTIGGLGENEWTGAGWVQAGYHEPSLDIDITAEYGRFLDGDNGGRLAVIRRWNHTGVGFWISRTDRLTPGKNYTNAGMTLEIPADAWFGNRSDHIWTQEFTLLSTWEDFAARQPGSWRDPDRLLGQLLPDRLGGNLYAVLDDFCATLRGETPAAERRSGGLFDGITK